MYACHLSPTLQTSQPYRCATYAVHRFLLRFCLSLQLQKYSREKLDTHRKTVSTIADFTILVSGIPKVKSVTGEHIAEFFKDYGTLRGAWEGVSVV